MAQTGTDQGLEAPAQAVSFTVSARAAKRIAELLAEEGKPGQVLRVSVTGGGCAGFQYVFDFDDAINDDDQVIERDGARVVVDEMSLGLLAGSELDFVENLIGSFFSVNNPNATSSCGCGTSFSM
ncbi:MAG: iron-sulfur cluster insertion protein ErpA [Alphaproteobacteria bacterium]|nr:iron-sulfur cluster insertion protein ErpA [Alphaproteobacteria bacterium]